MTRSVFVKSAVSILVLGLVGCAGVSTKEDQIDSVVSSQSDVLKKIVTLRQQEAVKTRINSDPVLAEQENVLMSGLDSVINSQEAFLRARNKTEEIRGVHVR